MAIHSIWDNDFYSKMPVPKWSFEMDFTQLFINQPDNSYAETLNKAVVSCTWPERSVTPIPIYFAGVEGRLPGRAQNAGELEIKFNENTSFKVTKILEELFHAESYCDAYFEGKGGYSFNKNFNKDRRVIRMKILNPTVLYELNSKNDKDSSKAPVIIEYHNCWVTKIGPEEMSYDSETEVITKSATFAYDYFKVLGNGESQINDTCAGDK